MRSSKEYDECVRVADEFVASRDLSIVADCLQRARLYVGAFRSLDTYRPTMEAIGSVAGKGDSKACSQDLKNALMGLKMLYSFRYRPLYNDHRILPCLLEYHQILYLVEDGLASASREFDCLKVVYENFMNSIEKITTGNGLYVVGWKGLPDYHFTYYKRVGLQIARILAVDDIGMYVVKFSGSIPIHRHRFLEEHHFLPEPIEGLHYMDGKVCKATETDILYIKNGQAHGFKSLGEGEVAFLFVCGSEKTGPWDFIQDIEVLGLDYRFDRLHSIDEVGGKDLVSVLEKLRKKGEQYHERLSPESMRLFHECVKVCGDYRLPCKDTDIIVYVVEGSGMLDIEGLRRDVGAGEAFAAYKGMNAYISGTDLIIYQFGYA